RAQAALLASLVTAFAWLFFISVPRVKEPLYILPLLPFLYALAGLSLSWLLAAPLADARVPGRARVRGDTSVLVLIDATSAVLCPRVAAAHARGILPHAITREYAVAHALGMAASISVCVWALRGSRESALYATGALALAAVVAFMIGDLR